MPERTPKNMECEVDDGGMLIIKVNLGSKPWRSSTGKSLMVATSDGFMDVPGYPGFWINLKIGKALPKVGEDGEPF